MGNLLERYKLCGEELNLTEVEFDDGIFLAGYVMGLQLDDLTDTEIVEELIRNDEWNGDMEWEYILVDVLLQRRKRKIDKIKNRINLKNK